MLTRLWFSRQMPCSFASFTFQNNVWFDPISRIFPSSRSLVLLKAQMLFVLSGDSVCLMFVIVHTYHSLIVKGLKVTYVLSV